MGHYGTDSPYQQSLPRGDQRTVGCHPYQSGQNPIHEHRDAALSSLDFVAAILQKNHTLFDYHW